MSDGDDPEKHDDSDSTNAAGTTDVEVISQEEAAWRDGIRKVASETPDVRYRHSNSFSDDEDKIIAAGMMSLTPLTKIAQTIRCARSTLVKHIEENPILSTIRSEIDGQRRDMIQDGIDELCRIRHPNVLMWAAEKLLPDIYGKERPSEDEDDSRLVIGEISEEECLEADRAVKEAEIQPPEVGVSALADHEALSASEPSVQQAVPVDRPPTPVPAPTPPPPPPPPLPPIQDSVPKEQTPPENQKEKKNGNPHALGQAFNEEELLNQPNGWF